MMGRAPLEAVICDAGGTLIRLDFEWMADDLGVHGFAIDAAILRRAEVEGRRAYDASFLRPVKGPLGATPRGDVREYFGGTLAAAGVPRRLVHPAVDRLLDRERERGLWCRPMEGAREAIDALRAMGLRVAVVSNSDGRAELHLANAGMLSGIEFVVDSHVVGVEKPDPAIFAVALARLGTRPERTLFVGDIRSVDEAGARAAGMRFVLLDPHGDYGTPGMPSVVGMRDLAAWVAVTFETVPSRVPEGVPSPGPSGSGRRSG
jgi:HAD superfamily hydrolase (TIGR01509 family)